MTAMHPDHFRYVMITLLAGLTAIIGVEAIKFGRSLWRLLCTTIPF